MVWGRDPGQVNVSHPVKGLTLAMYTQSDPHNPQEQVERPIGLIKFSIE